MHGETVKFILYLIKFMIFYMIFKNIIQYYLLQSLRSWPINYSSKISFFLIYSDVGYFMLMKHADVFDF